MSGQPNKPILCLDFDGVIHRYSRGWQGGDIYDPPTEGFAAWAERAAEFFRLVVYSSRSNPPSGIMDMIDWMERHGINPDRFEFSTEKPPAFLTIDDRAVRFDGDWSARDFDPVWLLNFKPWTQR